MPNIAQVLKAEIARISKKEIKSTVKPLHSSIVGLKINVVDLKRRIAILETENKQLSGFYKKTQKDQPQISPDVAEKARITSKSVRAIRSKLGLSQDSFAKLLGLSSQNVFVMEHKEGRLKMRPSTLTKLLAVRGMGKREAQKRLKVEGMERSL
jgi:DNA-binding transcriptional regulator YiaG